MAAVMARMPGLAVVEWAAAGQAMPGEAVSGDLAVVEAFAGGALVAVVDGLGHGDDAAAAAAAAVAVLRSNAGDSIMQLVRRCHAALRHSRGAVLSLATFRAEADTMTWLGIGNVEGVLFRADRTVVPTRESLLARSGVVGYQLPPLRERVLAVGCGDTLIFATDGIHQEFSGASPLGRSPQEVADDILDRYGKCTDDSLVLVACYLGHRP
jgi:phosphoserine phosphatase RsbX